MHFGGWKDALNAVITPVNVSCVDYPASTAVSLPTSLSSGAQVLCRVSYTQAVAGGYTTITTTASSATGDPLVGNEVSNATVNVVLVSIYLVRSLLV